MSTLGRGVGGGGATPLINLNSSILAHGKLKKKDNTLQI